MTNLEVHLVFTGGAWYHRLWWWLRGVGAADYRRICARCGRTGQAHYSMSGCRRYRNV